MDLRVDFYPTHEQDGIKFRIGHPLPFGASAVPNGINFSICSSAATSCTLVLFHKNDPYPYCEILFPDEFRLGDVYSMVVFDLDTENLEYGYRMDGPWDPAAGHRFDKTKILCDPYAKLVGGRDIWLKKPNWDNVYQYRARLAFDDFDWEGDKPLEIPFEDLIVYEMHVRGFSADESFGTDGRGGAGNRGTYSAIRQKIPYLKELGINCVELLPIFEFDEWEGNRVHPDTGELLINYWGYSTHGFFAPKASYAATGKFGMQMDEVKTLVRDLHAAGIEVILDVVFNHTAEGDQRGPTISFRGIDNRKYYILTPEGFYYNFSGTGNTFNCNNPVVRGLVLDSLRFWASEYHIDGFRFDLASILGRDQNGAPLSNPPLLETLAGDPVLAKCKLIAEAWDAGGMYQVGSFPAYQRWAEWNGKYRDSIRGFLKGDTGLVPELINRIQGSPDLYDHRGPTASINFITCHDGFTLRDLFSYNEKHNYANGENNNDGGNDNASWNCGAEGETFDEGTLALRSRLSKNAIALLMLSRGVPMILMGDEMGRTQQGNNNAYCHDSKLSWMDWSLAEANAELLRFAKLMIKFRDDHPVLRSHTFFQQRDYVGCGLPDISFHGTSAWSCDASSGSRCFAYMLSGQHAKDGTVLDDDIYVALNMYWDALPFSLPRPRKGASWRVAANTSMAAPYDVFDSAQAPLLESQDGIVIGGRSIVVLTAQSS